MTTITREQQKQILIDTANHVINRENTSPYSENLRELARIALASLETEPVADVVAWSSPNEERQCDIRWRRHDVALGPLYTAPPAPVVPDDYFSSLVAAARVRADKAMRKFPQPNYVLNKVAEESGEVIKAVIHYTEGREEWTNVEGEIIDNLAMLIRLITEGDQVIGFTPPDICRTTPQPVPDPTVFGKVLWSPACLYAGANKDHNHHPAHGPVSLARLHRMRDILSKAAEQRDGGDIGYAMSDAVKLIDEVLTGSKPMMFIDGDIIGYEMSDGIEVAAKWVDKQREAYDNEHGRHDPDTHAFEFGSDAQRDYSDTLAEIAEGIRSLTVRRGDDEPSNL